MKVLKIASALGVLMMSGTAFGQACETTVLATDAMKYDTKHIAVPASCKAFTVTLKHTGRLAKSVMGHNWVLTQPDQAHAVASDGISAGLANNYLVADDKRVIAATKVIGSGEEASVTFDVDTLKSDQPYTFFCSYPGHISMMMGELEVVSAQ